MTDLVSTHYDKKYFDWQVSIGEFDGWANLCKFIKYISHDSEVLDFGCGGGFLLKNIKCKKKEFTCDALLKLRRMFGCFICGKQAKYQSNKELNLNTIPLLACVSNSNRRCIATGDFGRYQL